MRLRLETEGLHAVSHLKGFPDYYGTVIREPQRSFVMEYLGDPELMRPWTLLDLVENRGPAIDNEALLKVRSFMNGFWALLKMPIFSSQQLMAPTQGLNVVTQG